jgi:hypothetical protein
MSLSDSTPQKMYDALKKQPIAVMARTWRSDGCAPRPVLEESPVVRDSELSCRLWVCPFSHKALAVAGGGGGRIKKVGFCRENVIFELPYPAARLCVMLWALCVMLWALCVMLWALCVMLWALCLMLWALCVMLWALCFRL